MNTNASTEGKGMKELKVTQTNDAEKLIDNYFAEYIEERDEEVEYVLSTHGMTFTTNEQIVKTQGGDENEQNFASNIQVLENGKRDFVVEEIAKGAELNVKSADLKKVKAKADKIRKENADKKREKSDVKDDREEK